MTMIEQKTLANLLDKDIMNKIIIECDDLGLSNVRLFVTHEPEDWQKIHFIGKSEMEGNDLFLIQQTEEEISKLLGCDVVVRAEHMLDEIIKEEALSNTAAYTLENQQGVQEFFTTQILPLAQKASASTLSEEEEQQLAQEVLSQLQKDVELWDKVFQHPGCLTAAENLLKHSQPMEISQR